MNAAGRSGKNGAALGGRIADRDDVVKRLTGKFAHVLGPLVSDIDASFPHDSDGKRMDRRRVRSRADGRDAISAQVPQQAFRHLRARGVPRAQDEHAQLASLSHHTRPSILREPILQGSSSPVQISRPQATGSAPTGANMSSGAVSSPLMMRPAVSPTHDSRHGSTISIVSLVVLAVIWGGSVPLIKLGLRDFPPLTLTALRYLVAAPLFALLILGRPLPPTRTLVKAGGVGALGIGGGQVAQTLGVQLTPASVATVITATIPILVVVFAVIRLRQPIHTRHAAGLVIAFIGVTLVAAGDPRLLVRGLTSPQVAGDALMILSAVMISLYYVLSLELMARSSAVTIAAVTSLAGAAALAPLGAWEMRHAAVRLTEQGVGVVLYLALLVTVAGLLVWFRALRQLPARTAAALQYLQPLVGVAASAALFGDRLGLWFGAGTGLVFVGIALTTTGSRLER